MKTTPAAACLLVLMTVAPVLGHEHKVLGVVTTAKADSLKMTTVDGKDVTVKVTADTKVTKGKDTVKVTSLTQGTRIVVTTESDTDPYTAKVIQVGVAKPVVKGKKPSTRM
jgi:hypothetical protein